jgi:hypothetical protein
LPAFFLSTCQISLIFIKSFDNGNDERGGI